jgi:hypothetical protein
VVLKELTPEGKKAALGLLQSSLSEAGFTRAKTIMNEVESALREMEGNPGRDSELYYVAFFGKPSATGNWGWKFEGHHLSFNFTYREGKVVSTTPQFIGSNPAEIREGPHKGLRVLAKEEDLARELAKSLSSSQLKEALLDDRAPADILTGGQRKAAILEDKGLAFGTMSEKQRSLLKDLVGVLANVQKPVQARARMSKIEKAGWERVKFAWMGGLEPGEGHYYRIQGSTFLIEYDNTQNGANHIHTVWRDFEGDFGGDVLAEHYRTAEHHRRS